MNTTHSLSMLIEQKLEENNGRPFAVADIVDIAVQNAEYAVAHYAAYLEGVIAKELQRTSERRNDNNGSNGDDMLFVAGAIQAYNNVFDLIGPESRYFYASVAKEKWGETNRHDDRQ